MRNLGGGSYLLVCKPFNLLRQRAERVIEASDSLFPPEFTAGWLELNNFITQRER